MKTLKNWRAKRSGKYLTVYGEDAATGVLDKITCVDQIEPAAQKNAPYVVAVGGDIRHTLLI